MELIEILKIIDISLKIVIVIFGTWLSIYFTLRFMPVLEIITNTYWLQSKEDSFILKIDLVNKSKVRLKKEIVSLQILEYDFEKTKLLSEWVPFKENKIIASEKPLQWNNPVEILTTTDKIEASEKISVERLIKYDPEKIYHIGIQFCARFNWFEKIINRFYKKNERWTSTIIVFRPEA